jgi:hypothetical protein
MSRTQYHWGMGWWGLVGLLVALVPAGVWGQTPAAGGPQLLLVQPPGGQAGQTVEITCVGLRLDEAQELYFSHPGFRSERVDSGKAAVKLSDIQKKVTKPTAAQRVRFRVHIPADAPLGNHDLRVITAAGISNARTFVVGDLPEYLEKEPNNDVPEAQRVPLNCVVHGIIEKPIDVDYYRFSGKKGQHVVLACEAADLDSKLEPEVQLYGPSGALLAEGHGYRPGLAVCDAVLPADGDYDVRVCSFAYIQGGEDCFYRLRISTTPWIDAVFPPLVEPGKKTSVTVYGRNLSGGQPAPHVRLGDRVLEQCTLTVTAPAGEATSRLAYSGRIEPAAAALDGFELRLRNEAGSSNPFLLTYARAPVVLDKGDNDTPASAQEIPVPCEVAGRFEKLGDRDWYVFTARPGMTYRIEALAARLGAPLDLQLSLYPAGKETPLVELDDSTEQFLPQLLTRSEDPPSYRFIPPTAGRYLIRVQAAEASLRAGPRQFYRLRIGPEEPDFHLIALPPVPGSLDTCLLPAGGRQLFTLLVWRHDGFEGAIRLKADKLPPGVVCPPQVLPPGSKLGYMVLQAEEQAPPWTGEIHLWGEAEVNGRTLRRQARPLAATWPAPPNQVNLFLVARLERSLVLAVRGQAPFVLTTAATPQVVMPGRSVNVPVTLKRRTDATSPVQITALSLPPGLTFANLTLPANKEQAAATFTAKPNASPGVYTVVLRGQVAGGDKKKKKDDLQPFFPSNPLTLIIPPRELAKVTVPPVEVKAGGTAEVKVRLSRLYDYSGPFEVKLIVPADSQGLSAPVVQVPAGVDEVRLMLHAAATVRRGLHPNLTLQLTGRYLEEAPVTQSLKIKVNVSK